MSNGSSHTGNERLTIEERQEGEILQGGQQRENIDV